MSSINNTPDRWPGPGRSSKDELRKYVAVSVQLLYLCILLLVFSLILILTSLGSVDVLTKIQVTLTSSSKVPSLMFTDVDFDDSGSIEVDRIFSQCSSCLTLELAS